MIIEFEDKYGRSVIVDTEFICALVENVEYTATGDNTTKKDGTWSVVMSSGNFFWEVTTEMKDKIYEVWEEHNG
jgi:hypothetical protein